MQYVIKRNGVREDFDESKIIRRVLKLEAGLDHVDSDILLPKIRAGLVDGMTIAEIDILSAATSMSLIQKHPDYGHLAGRFEVSNLHKNTPHSLVEVAQKLRAVPGSLSLTYYAVLERHGAALDHALQHKEDYKFDWFAVRTLINAYLFKIEDTVIERPQQMLMRTAVGIHGFNIDAVLETYDLMSKRKFLHATPTLFNAGTNKCQMSSCYLLQMRDDSLIGIYDTLTQCAQISKYAGGIGLAVHKVRATGSRILGTNGRSTGLVPMLRVFDATAEYVNQGGKRKGSIALYLEPWHADIYVYLNAKRPGTKHELSARSLLYGLWIPDLFMERVKANKDWTLFSPDKAPGLETVHGKEFEALYTRYEVEGRGSQTVRAQDLFYQMFLAQKEAGGVYLVFKDACNAKSNQKNLGTIQCSNLCTEIVQYTSEDEVAVCNLASISLPAYYENGVFDFEKLRKVAGVITRNLNKIIDINFYPIPEARNSNMRHRPIGVGLNGLADLFAKMFVPFDSEEAKKMNIQVSETIYYGCLEASIDLAKTCGTYCSFVGSPFSKGILQFDMWGVTPTTLWDWNELRANLTKYGTRNSLLTTIMPTASTSQIQGNNECIEPYTSNIYIRQVLKNDVVVVNKWLVKALLERGLWNKNMEDELIANRGSIQNIDLIPNDVKKVFRTVYEIPQKQLIDMAADRGPFIDQSQSLNLYKRGVTYESFSSMHFHVHAVGLKGSYYLHSGSDGNAQAVTVDPTKSIIKSVEKKDEEEKVCLMCSS